MPASELIDPRFERPLRVAPMAQLDFDIPDMIVIAEPKHRNRNRNRRNPAEPEPERVENRPEPAERQAPRPTRSGKRVRPAVPAWEDVLLGVRSSGDR